MFALSLLWLILGPCSTLLISLAQPIHHRRATSLLLLLLTSTLLSLATGWLGTWLYGRIAATALILCLTPTCLWLLMWLRERRRSLAHP